MDKTNVFRIDSSKTKPKNKRDDERQRGSAEVLTVEVATGSEICSKKRIQHTCHDVERVRNQSRGPRRGEEKHRNKALKCCTERRDKKERVSVAVLIMAVGGDAYESWEEMKRSNCVPNMRTTLDIAGLDFLRLISLVTISRTTTA
eukprot:PhM_4_TR9517/c2_g3_i13/m.98302